jgi:hypothetical protein
VPGGTTRFSAKQRVGKHRKMPSARSSETTHARREMRVGFMRLAR